MTQQTPRTDPMSSATPHMSALRHHLDALRTAHHDLHGHVAERVAEASRAHRAKSAPPPPEDTP